MNKNHLLCNVLLKGFSKALKYVHFLSPIFLNEIDKFNFVFHPNFIVQNFLQLLIKMLLDGMASKYIFFKLWKISAIMQKDIFLNEYLV
jgi:hypothetical protein